MLSLNLRVKWLRDSAQGYPRVEVGEDQLFGDPLLPGCQAADGGQRRVEVFAMGESRVKVSVHRDTRSSGLRQRLSWLPATPFGRAVIAILRRGTAANELRIVN